MAARGETGWQSEKTLEECTRYMLDNEIATDVIFDVGPPNDATVNIRAHKFMLTSRSAVFEAMFSSGMTECRKEPHATIRIEDIDAAIFKDLLRYIYCEIVSVNMETAASLMYAANKYLLPKLVRECGKCLSEGLNLDNVTHVLGQSLLFDDAELRKKSLTLIGQNAKAVLTGTEIQFASRQTMESIIKMDRLPVKETLIYETCLSWAKHQLQIQRSTENPTDQELRDMLGDVLYQIRFPIMEQTEFAEISEGRNVLTAEEKLSIYYFLATKKEGSQLLFPIERRFGEEVWIDRSITCLTGAWNSTPTVDAINFTTDQDILLTGIGLYTGHNGAGYGVDVEILQSTNSLYKKNLTVPSTGDMNQFKVTLDEPLSLTAGMLYSIKALSRATIGHYGSPCQAVCSKEKTTFTFSIHPESHTSTNINAETTVSTTKTIIHSSFVQTVTLTNSPVHPVRVIPDTTTTAKATITTTATSVMSTSSTTELVFHMDLVTKTPDMDTDVMVHMARVMILDMDMVTTQAMDMVFKLDTKFRL